MMACRRLAREAVAASLRRGAATAPIAPARAFSTAAASCSSRAPVVSPIRHFLARYSSPPFQPRAAEFGPSLAARVALGLRPQLSCKPTIARYALSPLPFAIDQESGRRLCISLLKGFGISTVLWKTLHQGKVTAATREQPSKVVTRPTPGSLKNELGSFWPLVRKLQLPIGLMFLILSGWQFPLGLVINILLLIYCSRPSHYSIYLFLQELRHRETGQNHAMWKEEFVRTRNVDTKDYKFFSIGTVELADGRVLHLIGMLGSWWIYRVSYVK
ncbi:hypothetical protein BAE44_0019058 [Dichanthelium oligosanthes]|uniref:Uncharacterized protein n=1 Tax=Dichanthelium oligosanthes TaxID=888268 RepID=A0A1E5V439_9POAL|nr:hypothetical protein BAE44_0019058 [Dichanthelium oligosanthes]